MTLKKDYNCIKIEWTTIERCGKIDVESMIG
jgi:hypothetical protein